MFILYIKGDEPYRFGGRFYCDDDDDEQLQLR